MSEGLPVDPVALPRRRHRYDRGNVGARAAATATDVRNVEFRQGVIEDLPIEDGSVDVVISNGVINLCRL